LIRALILGLNPQIPGGNPDARYPVSVEAIKGFLDLAKRELDIKDEAALASILNTLAEKVHPLVLGEVYRAIGQIKMLAKRLLANQVTDEEKVEKIISFLCSESGSHDYTINRREAAELGLTIEKPTQELYCLIRNIYSSIKKELEIGAPFDPNMLLGTDSQVLYSARRVIIESKEGKKDCYVTEGMLNRITLPGQPGMAGIPGIQDTRRFEGWRHFDE